MKLDFDNLEAKIQAKSGFSPCLGKVTKIVGLIIEADGLKTQLGELCYIERETNHMIDDLGIADLGRNLLEERALKAEVVGFRDTKTLLMPLGEMRDIQMGAAVIPSSKPITINIGPQLLGRVIDPFGNFIDDGIQIKAKEELRQWSDSPHPLKRSRITERIHFGLRAIDAFLSCGMGQRLGIFSGSGIGKSTLLGMLARNSNADLNVIALVGERGREVREFIEDNLGAEGLKKSIVIVATGDEANLLKVKAALFAHSIAEYFRDIHGKNVLLMLDSVTRVALAQREIGLAIGEPPATRGYTPSVFALLPKLLERSGTGSKGTITALYTVLVEGDDLNEPVSDIVRGVLDGHIVLSRALAERNHFPAIDVLASISRVMPQVVDDKHRVIASQIRSLLATYKEAQDLINIGAYHQGSNPEIDKAIKAYPKIIQLLKQDVSEHTDYGDLLDQMAKIIV